MHPEEKPFLEAAEALPALEAMLRDREPYVREAAGQAIGSIRRHEVQEPTERPDGE